MGLLFYFVKLLIKVLLFIGLSCKSKPVRPIANNHIKLFKPKISLTQKIITLTLSFVTFTPNQLYYMFLKYNFIHK